MPETFPPAQSALNLRLLLAAGGVVVSVVLGVLVHRALGLGPAVPLYALAAVAAINTAVVLARRRQRRQSHAGADHGHDSLFE
jgi:hypothetical protein